jgi:hypothetical protein
MKKSEIIMPPGKIDEGSLEICDILYGERPGLGGSELPVRQMPVRENPVKRDTHDKNSEDVRRRQTV